MTGHLEYEHAEWEIVPTLLIVFALYSLRRAPPERTSGENSAEQIAAKRSQGASGPHRTPGGRLTFEPNGQSAAAFDGEALRDFRFAIRGLVSALAITAVTVLAYRHWPNEYVSLPDGTRQKLPNYHVAYFLYGVDRLLLAGPPGSHRLRQGEGRRVPDPLPDDHEPRGGDRQAPHPSPGRPDRQGGRVARLLRARLGNGLPDVAPDALSLPEHHARPQPQRLTALRRPAAPVAIRSRPLRPVDDHALDAAIRDEPDECDRDEDRHRDPGERGTRARTRDNRPRATLALAIVPDRLRELRARARARRAGRSSAACRRPRSRSGRSRTRRPGPARPPPRRATRSRSASAKARRAGGCSPRGSGRRSGGRSASGGGDSPSRSRRTRSSEGRRAACPSRRGCLRGDPRPEAELEHEDRDQDRDHAVGEREHALGLHGATMRPCAMGGARPSVGATPSGRPTARAVAADRPARGHGGGSTTRSGSVEPDRSLLSALCAERLAVLFGQRPGPWGRKRPESSGQERPARSHRRPLRRSQPCRARPRPASRSACRRTVRSASSSAPLRSSTTSELAATRADLDLASHVSSSPRD